MRLAIIALSVLAVGCVPTMKLDDYAAPGAAPGKKAQDFAACQLEVERIKPEEGLIIGEAENRVMNKCMASKGYTLAR